MLAVVFGVDGGYVVVVGVDGGDVVVVVAVSWLQWRCRGCSGGKLLSIWLW